MSWLRNLAHRPLFPGKGSSEVQIDDSKNKFVLQKLLGVACSLLIIQWDDGSTPLALQNSAVMWPRWLFWYINC